jgi:Tol biopolymer transport system component
MLLVTGLSIALNSAATLLGGLLPSQEIAYINTQDFIHRLYVVDVAHGLSYRLTAAPIACCDFRWSPDGQRIVFTSSIANVPQVFVVNHDGSALRTLTIDNTWKRDVRWMRDSTQILYSSHPLTTTEDADLYLVDADNREARAITNTPEVEISSTLSPDGNWIAFFRYDNDSLLPEIVIINMHTGVIVAAFEDATNYDPLQWSPDSTCVLFTLLAGGGIIYVLDVQTGQSEALTNSTQSNYRAEWSPDGTQIVFVSERDANPEIYVMNADGSAQRRLTDSPSALEDYPTWSPDGTQIAFSSTVNGQSDIYMMNADGSNIRRVTSHAYSWLPRWRP